MSDVKHADVLDTRDLAEHVRELAAELANPDTTDHNRDEAADTMDMYAQTLAEFHGYINGTVPTGEDPEAMAAAFERLAYVAGGTMVVSGHFVDYVKDLCEQVGDIPVDLPHWIVVDWQKTADNLAADYEYIEHDDVTYMFR